MDLSRAVATYGDRRNPAILFLHGIRLSGRIWREHAAMLSDEFYVIAPDLPGHGALADLPFDVESLETFLRDIIGQAAHPPLLVGYSLGGYLAMRFAADCAEQTGGLVLTGCTTDIVGPRKKVYEAAVALTRHLDPVTMQRLLTAFFHLTLPPRIAREIIPYPFNRTVFEASRALVCGVRYSSTLRAYRKPVLIANGRWDLAFRRDERAYASAARAEVTILPGAHVAPLLHPALFCSIVRALARAAFASRSTYAQGPRA